MRFIRIQCSGCLNSFRQPDFHTYHKTLPLPTKTTIAGMIGSAMGLSPESINDDWLKNNRFQMGIIGKRGGMANDLWQIRKYTDKQIKAYEKGTEIQPYKTAVIVRELLYAMEYIIYLSFKDESDFDLVVDKLYNPQWALSLGREDELIRITKIEVVELRESKNLSYQNTVLPIDLSMIKYSVQINSQGGNSNNLLEEAPQIIKMPTLFSYNKEKLNREAIEYSVFSFIGNLSILVDDSCGFFDEELNNSFQIF